MAILGPDGKPITKPGALLNPRTGETIREGYDVVGKEEDKPENKTREEIEEHMRTDPFLKTWENNYNENKERGLLEKGAPGIQFFYKKDKLKNIPAFFVAAGPSLEKNIQELKRVKDHGLIICADVILYRLMDEGIEPDIVVTIDPSDTIQKFWRGVNTKNIYLFAPTTAYPGNLEMWDGKIFLFNQLDQHPFKGKYLLDLTKPTKNYGYLYNKLFVGATMLQIAFLFRCNPMCFIGADFSFSDGKAYCKGFLERKIWTDEHPEGTPEYYKKIEDLKKDEAKPQLMYTKKDGTKIGTLRVYDLYMRVFIGMLNEIIMKNPGQIIYNCTEGGMWDLHPMMPLKEAVDKFCNDDHVIWEKLLFQPWKKLPKKKKKGRNKAH